MEMHNNKAQLEKKKKKKKEPKAADKLSADIDFVSKAPLYLAQIVKNATKTMPAIRIKTYKPTPECKGGLNGISPRKPADQWHRPARFPFCEPPLVTRPGIEPGSPLWEANNLTAQPPRPLRYYRMIPKCENSGVIRPGIEPGSQWWEASRLTAQPPQPPRQLSKWIFHREFKKYSGFSEPLTTKSAGTMYITVSGRLTVTRKTPEANPTLIQNGAFMLSFHPGIVSLITGVTANTRWTYSVLFSQIVMRTKSEWRRHTALVVWCSDDCRVGIPPWRAEFDSQRNRRLDARIRKNVEDEFSRSTVTPMASASILLASCAFKLKKRGSHKGDTNKHRGHGGNRAGRCRWSTGFLGDLQFIPALLHPNYAHWLHDIDSPATSVKTNGARRQCQCSDWLKLIVPHRVASCPSIDVNFRVPWNIQMASLPRKTIAAVTMTPLPRQNRRVFVSSSCADVIVASSLRRRRGIASQPPSSASLLGPPRRIFPTTMVMSSREAPRTVPTHIMLLRIATSMLA
ncbi:hypothetical protein PR048_022882 [Dryococelus australis]|uniref:Uncharacterized protein n=1 Tax=Dryococelus australis TaxID=614101 RepID=A0ABQ9GSJ7_9NEOP|nr:hypothetical protein PR048_022882 [Dryococelus australis]